MVNHSTCGTCDGIIKPDQQSVTDSDGTPHHLWFEECDA
jgi:hypothetical protein